MEKLFLFVCFLLTTLWFVWSVCTSFNGFIRVRLTEQVGITKQPASNGSDTFVIQRRIVFRVSLVCTLITRITLTSGPPWHPRPVIIWNKRNMLGWLSNRTGTSFDDGKARGKDLTRLPVPNLPLCHWSTPRQNIYACATLSISGLFFSHTFQSDQSLRRALGFICVIPLIKPVVWCTREVVN